MFSNRTVTCSSLSGLREDNESSDWTILGLHPPVVLVEEAQAVHDLVSDDLLGIGVKTGLAVKKTAKES